MAENNYYSSLSVDEIEQTLLGAVRFNADQSLTTSQKAAARANIGAGESNSTFKILGYFDTLQDLQEWLQVLPEPGDAYGIGTGSPYDIYVYDGAHGEWVNNGPIVLSDVLIDDEDISTDHTWSSTKINTDLSGKQNKITASGILKGNGSGGVSAAVAGTDYLTPVTNYSPLKNVTSTDYTLVASDIGKTLAPEYTTTSGKPTTFTLPQSVSASFPSGAEIAFFWQHSSSLKLVFSGGVRSAKAGDTAFIQNASYNFPDRFSMVAIKKTGSNSNGDWWIIQGNVEVVS